MCNTSSASRGFLAEGLSRCTAMQEDELEEEFFKQLLPYRFQRLERTTQVPIEISHCVLPGLHRNPEAPVSLGCVLLPACPPSQVCLFVGVSALLKIRQSVCRSFPIFLARSTCKAVTFGPPCLPPFGSWNALSDVPVHSAFVRLAV